MDLHTYLQTDLPTDTATYRDARTHLKRVVQVRLMRPAKRVGNEEVDGKN